jgi:hypothetical protein
MTTTSTHPTRTSPALPELPISVTAVGVAELLGQAADLPQPICIFIYDHQAVSMQFAKQQASVQAVTRWAARFRSDVTSEPVKGEDGAAEMWHRTEFDYYGIAVAAYAHIPAPDRS